MHIRWRGMELPSTVEVDRDSIIGKPMASSPLNRSSVAFGASVGNSLRRVLLSSLIGSAVTQIKIRGAQHEFTIDSLASWKMSLDIVLEREEPWLFATTVRRHAGHHEWKANQRRCDHGCGCSNRLRTLRVINKEHVIATHDRRYVPFMMEMVVENGRGYVPSTEHSSRGPRDRHHSDRCSVTARSLECDTTLKRLVSAKRPTSTS